MAAKSKKRLSKVENKLIKLDNLQLQDVICPICQSILIQPVTLPCYHGFCLSCFNGSIENNALCCPLCRLRIGSWLRKSTKQRSVVNDNLWKYIQANFAHEVNVKSKGGDINLPEDKPRPRLSAPGEIRTEYEAELERLRNERIQLEKKHIEETELLIKKIQEEEEEAHRKYLEALKRDEIVALQMQKESLKQAAPPPNTPCKSTKPRLKDMKIDSYLSKHKAPTTSKNHPPSVDINGHKPKVCAKHVNGASPEMVPSYGRLIKSIIEKKNKLIPGLWNKENGDKLKEKKEESKSKDEKVIETEDKCKTKNGIPSLLVSLPLPYSGILQQKVNLSENRKETGSVDSMREELCFFKPILVSRPASMNKELPLRVPGIRATPTPSSPSYETAPSRTQYFESLCHLRNLSLANNLPSAFVIALTELKVNKDKQEKCDTTVRSKTKKLSSSSPYNENSTSVKRKQNRKHTVQVDGINKKNNKTNLRRTRSMGSITKAENETTPSKAKTKRKTASDRKPYLRSDSKKSAKKEDISSATSTNNNKVNLAVKNLSSPLKNCEVKQILNEQLRIEKIIEQEKSDLEFARRLEAELNEPRTRRAAVKRQVTLNHSLRPAKKLKV